MQPINERTVLITILGILGVATLFCLLGIAIPGWGGVSVFSIPSASPAALCIISFILLIGSVIVGVIIFMGIVQHIHLPLIFVGLLVVTSIFLLGAFTSVTAGSLNHAYNLVITSFTFTYLSSILATYWLFGARQGGGITAPSTSEPSKPTLQIT